MKVLLTSKDLIAHMDGKGIKFNIIDKISAEQFLKDQNYYMKLASYRYNYRKYYEGPNKGQYIGLEFAYLKELSIIDMQLRYFLLQMTLDIEHALKVKLLQAIENNPHDDGYHLIQCFISKDKDLKSLKKMQVHKSSDYCKDLIEKYYPYFPAWVFVELISFGDLSYLCEYYYQKNGIKIADRILLNSVRDLRNASAHNNCLISRLSPGKNNPHRDVVERVKTISSISESSRRKKLKNKFLYDFTCLMFAYDEIIVKDEKKQRRYQELMDFFNGRMIKNESWFYSNTLITSSYNYAKKIVDNFLD